MTTKPIPMSAFALHDQIEERLTNWFTYHQPADNEIHAYKIIRETARVLAQVIMENTPICADQTAALRKVREAVMTANAAIACKGQ